MTLFEIKRTVIEAFQELEEKKNNSINVIPVHSDIPKMEFSKKLIISASFFYGLMCVFGIVVWFTDGYFPQFIPDMAFPYGLILSAYCCKSGYENRAKIERGNKQ